MHVNIIKLTHLEQKPCRVPLRILFIYFVYSYAKQLQELFKLREKYKETETENVFLTQKNVAHAKSFNTCYFGLQLFKLLRTINVEILFFLYVSNIWHYGI